MSHGKKSIDDVLGRYRRHRSWAGLGVALSLVAFAAIAITGRIFPGVDKGFLNRLMFFPMFLIIFSAYFLWLDRRVLRKIEGALKSLHDEGEAADDEPE